MRPLVSIITPAYNATRWIDESIASVVAQDYANIEHIVVDDASTDETVVFVERWLQVSSRIKLITCSRNYGVGPTINAGVVESSGEFLVVLASDDKLVPNYVMSCVEMLQRFPAVGFIYTDVCYFRLDGDDSVYKRVVVGGWDIEALRRRNPIGTCTFMMRRSVFDAVGGYRDIPHAEDYDFVLACAGLGIVGMPLHSVTSHIRVRPDSQYASATVESVLETDRMLRERHGDDVTPLWARDRGSG